MTSALRELTEDTRFRRLGGWRADAWHRLDDLARDIQRLQPVAEGTVSTPDRGLRVHEVEEELRDIGRELNSARPDEVWQSLHEVEEHIARLAQGEQLLDYAAWALDHLSDPALKGNRAATTGEAWDHVRTAARTRANPPATELAGHVASALHQAHSAIDRKHLEANNCSARLRTATIGLLALSALILLAAAALPQLPFLVGREKFQGVSAVQVSLVVALGGLIGGSWGAFPTFTSAERDAYRVQYTRAAARLAMGILSALIGVSLVGAGWVTGLAGDSAPALFAVSIAFGLAQEPVTRLLEGRLADSKEVDTSGNAKS
jgi:hypothetical protein